MQVKNLGKRLTSLILAGVLLAGSVPTSAFAESEWGGDQESYDGGSYDGSYDSWGNDSYEDYGKGVSVSPTEEAKSTERETQSQTQSTPQQETQVQTQEQIPALASTTIDVGAGSVAIYPDGNGGFLVEQGGETRSAAADGFTFTGKSAKASIAVASDRNLTIRLKDLELDADPAITLTGNVKFSVVVDGIVYLNGKTTGIFLSGVGSADFSAEDESCLIAEGSLGATNDKTPMRFLNGMFYAGDVFTGTNVTIEGGNLNAEVYDAVSKKNEPVYPVVATDLDEFETFLPYVEIDDEEYEYGWTTTDSDGTIMVWLPEGDLEMVVDKNVYKGEVSEDGLFLEPYDEDDETAVDEESEEAETQVEESEEDDEIPDDYLDELEEDENADEEVSDEAGNLSDEENETGRTELEAESGEVSIRAYAPEGETFEDDVVLIPITAGDDSDAVAEKIADLVGVESVENAYVLGARAKDADGNDVELGEVEYSVESENLLASLADGASFAVAKFADDGTLEVAEDGFYAGTHDGGLALVSEDPNATYVIGTYSVSETTVETEAETKTEETETEAPAETEVGETEIMTEIETEAATEAATEVETEIETETITETETDVAAETETEAKAETETEAKTETETEVKIEEKTETSTEPRHVKVVKTLDMNRDAYAATITRFSEGGWPISAASAGTTDDDVFHGSSSVAVETPEISGAAGTSRRISANSTNVSSTGAIDLGADGESPNGSVSGSNDSGTKGEETVEKSETTNSKKGVRTAWDSIPTEVEDSTPATTLMASSTKNVTNKLKTGVVKIKKLSYDPSKENNQTYAAAKTDTEGVDGGGKWWTQRSRSDLAGFGFVLTGNPLANPNVTITTDAKRLSDGTTSSRYTAITGSDGAAHYVALTDANGVATFTDIPYGTYTIKEILTPAQAAIWHDMTKSVPNVVLSDSSPVVESKHTESREYTNGIKTGHLTLKKEIETAIASAYSTTAEVSRYNPDLNGFVFMLTGTSDAGITYTEANNTEEYAITDANGRLTFPNVGIATGSNKYTIIELQKFDENGRPIAAGDYLKQRADAGNASAKKIINEDGWNPNSLKVTGITKNEIDPWNYSTQADALAANEGKWTYAYDYATQNGATSKDIQSLRQYMKTFSFQANVTYSDANANAAAGTTVGTQKGNVTAYKAGQNTTDTTNGSYYPTQNRNSNGSAYRNKLIKWTATFQKVDSESYGEAQQISTVEGAKYELWDGYPQASGSVRVGTFTTNAQGKFTVGNYVAGDQWYLREVEASDYPYGKGHLVDTHVYHVNATIENVESRNPDHSIEVTNLTPNAGEDAKLADGSLVGDDGLITAYQRTREGKIQTGMLYEPVKKNTATIQKVSKSHTAAGTGQGSVGEDSLEGAGFTVYELSTLREAYNNPALGTRPTDTDEDISDFFARNIPNDSHGNYENLILRHIQPATIYSEGALGATEHHDEYYSDGHSALDVTVNEVLDDVGSNPQGVPPLTNSYTYQRYKADGTMESYGEPFETTATNEYVATEFFTNEVGNAYLPMLPVGDYVIIETTVPFGKTAAKPLVIHIRSDHNDGTTAADGNGENLGMLDDGVVDEDMVAYFRITKRSTQDNAVVQKEGAGFVIYDEYGVYPRWLAEKSAVQQDDEEQFIADYVEQYTDPSNGKLLVVDLTSNPVYGTLSNPYTYKTSDNTDWTLHVPVLLPMGTYVIKEVSAPAGYVLYGHEGNFRVDDDGNTIWEVEDHEQAKWQNVSEENRPTEEDDGIWVSNEEMASEDRLSEKTFEISATQPKTKDPETGEYYQSVTWENDPIVGKISIYAEGDRLVGATRTGTTVAERVGDDFAEYGYLDAKAYVNSELIDESTFRNMEFQWENGPIEGAVFELYAAENIVSPDGSGRLLFEADAENPIATLTTDENGKAHTSSISTRLGTYKGLPLGKYKIVQKSAGVGRAILPENEERFVTLSEKKSDATLNYSDPIVYKDETYRVEKKSITLAIDKYDSTTHQHLDGAVFGLVAKSDVLGPDGTPVITAGQLVALSETYDGNKATFGTEDVPLPIGEYYLIEFAAPKGYSTAKNTIRLPELSYYSEDPSKTTYSFENGGYDDGYAFHNGEVTTYVRLADYFTDAELEGGEFEIREVGSDAVVATVTTHPDGENLVQGLEIGKTYEITQVTAPDGYVLETLAIPGRDLPFETKSFNGLEYPAYKLALTKTAETTVTFTLHDVAEIQVVNVFNKPYLGQITIEKKGLVSDVSAEDGYELGNDVLEIMRRRIPEFRTLTNSAELRDLTDSSMNYAEEGLSGAKYKVTALEAIEYPDGSHTVVLAEGDSVKVNGNDTFTTGSQGTVVVNKTDDMIVDMNTGRTAVGLLPGRYLVTEEEAPAGYLREVGTENVSFVAEITEDEVRISHTFVNPMQRMTMTLKKTAVAEGAPYSADGTTNYGVEGATYALVALDTVRNVNGKVLIAKGTKVDEKTTDADGMIRWRDDLPIGDYAAFEIEAPEGYLTNEEVIRYPGEQYKGDEDVRNVLMDEETTDEITVVRFFLKDFDTKRELADATFTILDGDNVVTKKLVVNGVEKTTIGDGSEFPTEQTNGTAHVIYGLEPGKTYVFRENEARYGYTNVIYDEDGTRFGDEYSFTVPTDEPTTTLELFNKRIVGSIELEKIGEVLEGIDDGTFLYDGAASLSGAKFTLLAYSNVPYPDGRIGDDGEVENVYAAGDEVVTNAEVGDDGKVAFENLYLGSYYVKEVEFPDGFVVKNGASAEFGPYDLIDDRTNAPTVEVSKPIGNERQKIRIDVEKRDAHTGELVGGGRYELHSAQNVNAPDGAPILIADQQIGETITLPTDGPNKGKASFVNDEAEADDESKFYLDLPLANYYVVEATPPNGYSSPIGDGARKNIPATYDATQGRELRFTAAFENATTQVAFDALDFNDHDERLVGTVFRISDPDEDEPDFQPFEVEIKEHGHNDVFVGIFNPGKTYKIEELTSVDGYSTNAYRKDRTSFTTPYAEEADGFPTEDGRRPGGVVTGDVVTVTGSEATFQIDDSGAVQVMTIFNKKKPIVAFDVMDYDTEEELFPTVLEISGGDLGDRTITVNVNAEGENDVIRDLNPDVTYVVTEKIPVYGYGDSIFSKSGFVSPYDTTVRPNGYSDGTNPIYPVVTSTPALRSGNVATFTVEAVDGLQMVTLFNKKVRGVVTLVKQGEVPTGYSMNGDVAVVEYDDEAPLEGVVYELHAAEKIWGDDGETLLYDVNDIVGEPKATDVDGRVEWRDLDLKNYYVVEKTALYGFVRSQDRFDAPLATDYENARSGDDPDYNSEVVHDIGTISNKRVRVDVGVVDETAIGEIHPGGDPTGDLKGKTGVFKTGHQADEPDEKTELDGVEFTLFADDVIKNVYGEIIFRKDVPVAKATTDADGRATFGVDLPVGRYRIEETKPKAGYFPVTTEPFVFDTDEYLSDDEDRLIQVLRYAFDVENVLSKMTFTLKDDKTKNELEGAKFQIKDENGTTVEVSYVNKNGDLTTGETIETWDTAGRGIAVFGLEPGKKYVIVETEARHDDDDRTGYAWDILDEDGSLLGNENRVNEYEFKMPAVDDARTLTLDLYNEFVTANLKVSKTGRVLTSVDADDEPQPLGNAKFALYATTDVKHPDGKTIVYHEGDQVRMNVRSTDDLANADLAEATTNDDGIATFEGLLPGTYELREIEVPTGYVRMENKECKAYWVDSQTNPLQMNDQTVDVENARQTVTVKIVKTSTVDGSGLGGVHFDISPTTDVVKDGTILFESGKPIGDGADTDDEGNAEFSVELPVDYAFDVYETSVPAGYVKDSTPQRVETTYRGPDVTSFSETLEFENAPVKVLINVLDERTKNELDGAKLEIYDVENPDVKWNAATSKSKTGDLLMLPDYPFEAEKTYAVRIVEPAPGYVNRAIIDPNYVSEYATEGYKDVDDETPSQAYDRTLSRGSEENVITFKVENNPKVQVVSIFAHEVRAEVVAKKLGDVIEKTLDDEGNVASLKYAEERKPLSGSEIVLTAADGVEAADGSGDLELPRGYETTKTTEVNKTTNPTGAVTFDGDHDEDDETKGLPLGTYELYEAKAPRGYVREADGAPLEIDLVHEYESLIASGDLTYADDYFVVERTFENEMQLVDVGHRDPEKPGGDPDSALMSVAGIRKVDASNPNKGVEGAVLGLFARESIRTPNDDEIFAADTLIDKATTDADGYARFTFEGIGTNPTTGQRLTLPVGKYYVKELTPPSGYLPTTEEVDVEADVHADDDQVRIVRFSDEIADVPTKLVVSVQDDRTFEHLGHVTFHVEDEEGNVVVTPFATTQAQNEYEFTGVLDPGKTYVLVEDAPETNYTYVIRDASREPIHDENSPNRWTFVVPDAPADGSEETLPEVRLEVYNEYVTGSITIAKFGEKLVRIDDEDDFEYDMQPLQGVEFELYAACALDSQQDDPQGIRHPDGWTEPDGGRKASSDAVQKPMYMPNELVATKTTGENTDDSFVRFDDLLPGVYYVKEKGQYEGYAFGEEVEGDRIHTFEIRPLEGQAGYVTQTVKADDYAFNNYRQKVRIVVEKTDFDTKEAIVDDAAEFDLIAGERILSDDGRTVLYESGATVDHQATNGEGVATFGDEERGGKSLPLRQYLLVETKAPNGYVLDSVPKPIDASYDETGEPVLTITYPFENVRTKTVFNVFDRKSALEDGVETNLVGTKFSVYDVEAGQYVNPDGSLNGQTRHIYEITNPDDPSEAILGLVPGRTYVFTEEQPRKGYKSKNVRVRGYDAKNVDGDDLVLGEGEQIFQSTFTIENEGGIQVVTVFNEPVLAELKVTKTVRFPRVAYVEGTNAVESITWSDPEPADGATFVVRAAEKIPRADGREGYEYVEGEYVTTLTTAKETISGKDVHGTDKIGELPLGKYVVEEVDAPNGYSIDESNDGANAVKTFDLMEDYYVPTMFETGRFNEDLFVGGEDDDTATFYNERQGIDVGDEPDDVEITNTGGDPDHELDGETGFYKYGVYPDGKEVPVDGAEFELRATERILDANGETVFERNDVIGKDLTADGVVAFTKYLPIGRYEVRETKAPKGFHSTNDVVEISTEEHEEDASVQMMRFRGEFRNPITTTVIYLKDDKTGVELEKATLIVKNPDGTIATDVNGEELKFEEIEDSHGHGIVIYGLEPGVEYVIKETVPPDDYTCVIRDEDGNPVDPGSVVRDEDGNAISGGDEYRFVIEDDPSGNPPINEITLYNSFVTGNVFVSKTGEVLKGLNDDGSFDYRPDFLEGVQFAIYAADDVFHPDKKTGPNGIATDGVQQALFKKGDLVLMNVRGDFLAKYLNDDGEVVEAVEETTGENGETIRTAVPAPARVLTDVNGIASFYGLYPGSYVIKEVEVPNGYVDEHKELPVTIARETFWKQIVEAVEGLVNWDNVRQTVKVTVTKRDKDDPDKTVGGAQFVLRNLDPIKDENGDVIYESGSDMAVSTESDPETGKATFDVDLPLGMYYVQEIKAPKGYATDEEQIVWVDARYQGEGRKELEIDVDFFNEQTKTVIEILDYEEFEGEHVLLGDTVIKLMHGDEEIPLEYVDGRFVARGLEPGETYVVVEEAPQYGYLANPVEDEFEDGEGRIHRGSEFVSDPVRNGFVIGYERYDDCVDVRLDSTEGNTFSFTALDGGSFQVVTAFNHRADVKLTVEKKGEVAVTTREHNTLEGMRYVVTGLPNAKYELKADEKIFHPNGTGRVMFEKGENVVKTLTGDTYLVTDDEGKAEIGGLYLGTYVLTEVEAPYGYSKFSEDATRTKFDDDDYVSPQDYVRTIDLRSAYDEKFDSDDPSSVEDVSVTETYENERIRVDLGSDYEPNPENPDGDPNADLFGKTGILKLGVDGETKKGVAGAVFELYTAEVIKDALGNVILKKDILVQEATTNDDGRATFDAYDLPFGNYYAVEKTPPEGYFSSSARVDFEVRKVVDETEEGYRDHVQVVRLQGEFENPISTTVVFLRDEVTKYELEGARFRVLEADGVTPATDLDGNPLEWTSEDTDGAGHVIKGLDPRKEYVLEEVLPRTGYTYILRNEDGSPLYNETDDDGDVVNRYRFQIGDHDCSDGTTPNDVVIDVYNRYVTANVVLSKDGKILASVSENQDEATSEFEYQDVDMEGVEFTIYALEDIVHPDGHTGYVMRGGDAVTIRLDENGTFVARMNALVRNEDGTFGDPAIATTGVDGKARWNDLFLGKYLIRETSTPEGYATNFDDKQFEAVYDADEPGMQHVDKIFEGDDGFHNELQKVVITVTKKDADDPTKTVPGAKFGLFAIEDIRNERGVRIVVASREHPYKIGEAIAGDDGVARFDDSVPHGLYVIRELDAPFGYAVNDEEIEVDARYQDDETHALEEQTGHDYEFLDEQTKTIINVLDYETLVELGEVHLTVTDEEGNVVEGCEDIVTTHEGNAIIRGLDPGMKYFVRETKPRYGYSNEIFVDNGYESVYATNGYDRNKESYGAERCADLYLEEEERNVASFMPGRFTKDDEPKAGFQVVTLFNKAVTVEVDATKEGPVPKATTNRVVKKVNGKKVVYNDLATLTYEVEGLPGAKYDVVTKHAIVHPDGWTNADGTLKKTAKDEQTPLYEAGDVVATIVTNDEGIARAENLRIGDYEVIERKAPRGYSKSEIESHVTRNADAGTAYGTEFDGVDDEVYDDFGIVETAKFENPRQIVDLGEDYSEIEDENHHGDPLFENYGKAGVYKIGVDGDERKGLANAKFTLYAEEDVIDVHGNIVFEKGTKIETTWSGDDGRARFTEFELPIGKYYVVEDEAPYGYYPTKTTVHFDATTYQDDDTVQMIRLTDEVVNYTTTVKVFLKDVTTKVELVDASIRIEDEDGKLVAAWITQDTDGEGYVIKGRILPGKDYYLTEVFPKDDNYTYVLRDDKGNPIGTDEVNVYKFRLDDVDPNSDEPPKDFVIDLYNAYVTGYVDIRKTGEILSDYNPDDDAFEYGEQELPGVEFALYAAEDIYHPDGETGPDGTTSKYTTGKQIPLFKKGAQVLMDTQTNPKIAVATTDGNGVARFEGLYPGKYEFREKTPTGYARNKDKTEDRTFTIVPIDFMTQVVQAREGLIEYTNKRQKVEIILTKLDADDMKPIAGAKFGLYAAADVYNDENFPILDADELVATAVSDEEGKVVFDANVPAATYYVKEIEAPLGYVTTTQTIDVDARWRSDGREVTTIRKEVLNDKTRVDVIKKTSDGNYVKDAQLAILDGAGEVVDYWTTKKAPHRTSGLVPGRTYVLNEMKPAPGYATAADVEFEVKGRSSEGAYFTQEVEMIDEPIRVAFRINEILGDDSLNQIGGVKYHVETPDGQVVKVGDKELRFVSSESADDRIDLLPIGDYVIVVDSVPDGYVKPNRKAISVKDTPELQRFEVNLPFTEIEIIAVDKQTRQVLTKVAADLTTKTGKAVLSDEPLTISRQKVAPGEYVVHVTKGPAGYVAPDDVPIVIKGETGLQTFVIEMDHTRIDVLAVDDETNEKVDGVIVDVVNKNGVTVAHDVPLELLKEYVASGPYVVVPTSVPKGYIWPENLDMYVRQTSELQTFELKLTTVKASFRPVDGSTHKVVKNVRMVLRGPDGEIYAEWKSEDGWKVFKPIPAGNYMLEATKVPKGYETPEKMLIKIENASHMQYFELVLTKKGGNGGNGGNGGSGGGGGGTGAKGNPQTGDDLNMTLLYLAIAFEILLAVLFAASRKKRKKA